MVNFEVPGNCTLSPSLATPHLTINHDVAADLDSSNAFEGRQMASTLCIVVCSGLTIYFFLVFLYRPGEVA